jgi:TetR/AcrR family transcriptional regulator, transcriptional repressor for nem operon
MARPKSFDEEAALEQAVRLFRERGYEATSLADLEAQLGVGRQSLYNTFGSKQALFLKALDRYRRESAEALLERLNVPGAGLDEIRAFFHQAVESLTSVDPRCGCLVTNTIVERGPQDAEALLRCNAARDVLERAFRRALAQAKARGELPAAMDAEALATLLVVHTYGLNVLAKTGATAAELHASVEALLAGLR